MFLIPLLLIILVIWFIAYLLRSSQSNTPVNNTSQFNSTTSNKAMEVLKERYAKGEISEQVYLKIKRNLE